MAKLSHVNLFSYGDKAEVYEALQKDYDRDTYVHSFWRLVLIGAAIGAAVISNHADWLWVFLGIYAAERSISKYLDNSNRNWAMHIIDWHEASRKEDD
jgi:hypothetical protein